MKRFVIALAAVGMLAACGHAVQPESSPEVVASAAFRESGPKSITLITVVNNRTGAGAHTGLLVKGSQTVIFDPAGSFRDDRVIERGDVLYGMTPGWVAAYKSAHARSTFHVVSQEFAVSDAQAEKALRLVQANGAVMGAYCANTTSGILKQIGGFENIKQTFYPVKLMEQVAAVPGGKTTRLYEDDDGGKMDPQQAIAAAKLQ